MISETDKAYAAGLFDGEGSVGISFTKQAKKSSRKSYQIKASIAMIDQDSILWMVSIFGGHYDTTNRTRSGNIVHRWTLHCRKAADFLELIVPYLKLKRARSAAAIKLARMARQRGAVAGHEGVHPLLDEEVAQQKPLAEFIRAENQRTNPKIAGYATWGVN